MAREGKLTMMATSAHMQYNGDSKQAERTPIFCKKTGKLLTRVDTASLAQLANVSGGTWCWCRGCHMEHYVLWSDIARARMSQETWEH